MLQAYRWAYGNFSGVSDLLSLLTNPEETSLFTLRSFPALVWGCLKGISSLGSENPAVNTKAADTLQCLLAIMLYYCQPSLFARKFSRLPSPPTDPLLFQFSEMLKIMAPPDTPVSLAGSKFQIIVGQGTLVAYVILCGVALVLCLAVLCIGSLKSVAGKIPDTTPFPSWDNDVHCEMKRVVNGDEVEAARGAELGRLKGGEMVRAAAEMRIKLAVGRRGARV